MKYLIITILFLSCLNGQSQEMHYKGDQGGALSLGVRSTYSLFNSHPDESNGLGMGGQFRVQFADRVNSDWFADYLQSNIGDYATRTDYHIGWSVLFYPMKNPWTRVRPYVLAGHCFDYADLKDNRLASNTMNRWSSAVQGGLGVHVNLTQRMDISFVGQYMMHLGNEIHAEYHDNEVHFHEEHGTSMEGHFLFHVSLNYKIADLW